MKILIDIHGFSAIVCWVTSRLSGLWAVIRISILVGLRSVIGERNVITERRVLLTGNIILWERLVIRACVIVVVIIGIIIGLAVVVRMRWIVRDELSVGINGSCVASFFVTAVVQKVFFLEGLDGVQQSVASVIREGTLADLWQAFTEMKIRASFHHVS